MAPTYPPTYRRKLVFKRLTRADCFAFGTGLFLVIAQTLRATGEIGPAYGFIKEFKYSQNDVGSIAPADNPYRFGAIVQGTSTTSINSASLALPAGSTATNPQALAGSDGSFNVSKKFADQIALDS